MGFKTAHAAPMYHVLCFVSGNIDCRTGKEKLELHETQTPQGLDGLSAVKRNSQEINRNTLLDGTSINTAWVDCNALMWN